MYVCSIYYDAYLCIYFGTVPFEPVTGCYIWHKWNWPYDNFSNAHCPVASTWAICMKNM